MTEFDRIDLPEDEESPLVLPEDTAEAAAEALPTLPAVAEVKEKPKKNTDPESLKSQVTVVLFWFLALFSTVFFIANIWDNAGPLIYGFCALLYGLFGWGGLLIVPFFILLALEWKNILTRGDGIYKTAIALLTVITVSTLFHIVMIMSGGIATPTFPSVFNSTVFWYRGTPLGGGVIGGFLGGILYLLMHGWVSVLTTVVILAALVMFYLRMTPLALVQAIGKAAENGKRRRTEKAAEKEAERKLREAEAKDKAETDAAIKTSLEANKDALEGTIRMQEKDKTDKTVEKKEEKRRADWFAGNAFSLEDKEDEDKPDETIHIPTVTVYGSSPDDPTDEDENESEEESAIVSNRPDSEELDAFDDTDFGDGIEQDSFDLSSLMGKKDADQNPEVVNALDELDEDDLDEDETDDTAEGGFIPPVVPIPTAPVKPYQYPPTTLLLTNQNPRTEDDREELAKNAKKLVEVLRSFKVETEVAHISCGPTITRYELAPKVGVRVRTIANLVDDIALNLETSGVRIEAPIPGKAAVGVEVPKKDPETVYLRDIIESPVFQNAKSKLAACVGMDVSGAPVIMDIAKLPHMLIAGATGMGKSVAVNCIIMSLLFRTTPDELKLILIDPKKVEFKPYDKLPHLLIPVVSNPKKAAAALTTAVVEMERRFELIEMAGVRDVKGYNRLAETDPTKEKLPSIVIIIDELADLMMTSKDEVEDSICRIAQKARAAGIHLIICTQRPSVDVITGLIKANVPSRIALTVASNVDSRTIIDVAGAEKLIGRGDMLFAPVGAMKPMRVQGAFVDDHEVEAVTGFIREHCKDVTYDDSFLTELEQQEERSLQAQQKKKPTASAGGDEIDGDDDTDPKFYEAVELAVDMGKISTSLLQRKLSLGYGRAAKIIDRMEAMGIVGAPEGQKPRNVIFTRQQYQELLMHKDD